MKSFFYLGVFLFISFEIANIYFIMPLPGSQEMESIDFAYFLYSKRWIIRAILGLIILLGIVPAWKASKWLPVFLLLIIGVVMYMTHFKMAADTMFYQPKNLRLLPASQNEVTPDRIVLGVEINGQAKAYPIQYLGYHHQVPDTIGGKPVIITYCTVCRTGRAYEPVVNGKPEKFRLVGMDHYNAMFEDHTTKSWWRQVTGEAVAGPLQGTFLPEVHVVQTSLNTWLQLYPNSLIMQPDPHFKEIYFHMSDYESGTREGKLTRRDSSSWKDKSWIAGIVIEEMSKAYDWNALVKQGVINDELGSHPVSVAVTNDQKGLVAFLRISDAQILSFRGDTLTDGKSDFNLLGQSMDSTGTNLKPIRVYQEYWHSWKTFHPKTEQQN